MEDVTAGFMEEGGPVGGPRARGAGALEGLLCAWHLFSGVKNEGLGSESPAPSLPMRISSKKTNITCFPLAAGQRKGKSVRALQIRDVWKVGLNSTQVMLL